MAKKKSLIDTVTCEDAEAFLHNTCPTDVSLFLMDPPYCNIVPDKWDRFKNDDDYVEWLVKLCDLAREKCAADGSLLLFQGIGKHGHHPIFGVVTELEKRGWQFRNWLTWKKRRAFGKKQDYLWCREEILWFSAGDEVRFNVPYTEELRGYSGFNKKYSAKSPFKRVSNVIADISEVFRPKVRCEKPIKLVDRLVTTHSMPGDTVADPFLGSGTTRIAALKNDRGFVGCDSDQACVDMACARCK